LGQDLFKKKRIMIYMYTATRNERQWEIQMMWNGL